MAGRKADHGGRQEARRDHPKNSSAQHNAERCRPDYRSARLQNDEAGRCDPRKGGEHQGQQAARYPATRGSDTPGLVPN